MSLRSLAARPAAVRRPSSLPIRRCRHEFAPDALPPACPRGPRSLPSPRRSACWRCSRPPSSRCRHSPLRNPLPQARCHRKARDDWRVRRPPSIRAMAPCRRSRRLRDTAVGAGRQARGGARTSGGTAVGRGGAAGCRSAAAEAARAFRCLHRRAPANAAASAPAGGPAAAAPTLPPGMAPAVEVPAPTAATRPDATQRGRRSSSGRVLPGTGRAARRNPADRGAPERDCHRPRPAARFGGLRSCFGGGTRRVHRRGASRRARRSA